MKNLKINKKKITSFLVALGLSASSSLSLADVISYNKKTTLSNGKEAIVYFITGNNENDYAYVSFDNVVGYISLNNVNTNNLNTNNDYYAVEKEMVINIPVADVYQTPYISQTVIKTLNQNDSVYVTAKNNDGWCIVSDNNFTGFLHESAFALQKEMKIIQIQGNNVNVRLLPNTKSKDNIIGQVNNGDEFRLINHENGWYLIDYYGSEAYVYDTYGIEKTESEQSITNNQVTVAKIIGNNVNVRLTPTTRNENNVIGFVDVTDILNIIDKENDWYLIDYLGQNGYVYADYVLEIVMNKEDMITKKMLYLTRDISFYRDTNGTFMTILPRYQLVAVINEEKDYYKVRVDSVIGYIEKSYTKGLTITFVNGDLGRQIVKVFKNNKEVYRAHMISGIKEEQTDIGIFKVGHKIPDYQLTPIRRVQYWIQYNDNEGLHDASWQEKDYFVKVADDAYKRYASGRALTYPYAHGSQGCDNLKIEDAYAIYNLVNIGDNVLITGPNTLIADHLISGLDINIKQNGKK